ncbi:MAG: hypothetical protein MR360_01320, partial [Ruminococcus sp.]
MKRTIRITIITVIIIAIGLVTMFVTPGTWKFGTNVYSNDFQKTPEDSLFHYYDTVQLQQSIGKAETDKTCLYLYFNGTSINVCEMIKNNDKYCYFGEKIKFKYGTDYMRFDKNQTVINDDVYYWDIIYENRKYLIRDDKFKSIDFTVTIGNETRNLSFV